MHATGEQSRHDWHSAKYVDGWISKDVKREGHRRPLLARMMALAPFPTNAPIRILDVAGGYGAVSEAALGAFPNARITIHDYSEIMLERARKHFADGPALVAYIQGDLTDPTWTTRVGGPFDLVVSGIAIHNLEEPALIADCYRAIRTLLVPGGCFLNCDHFGRAGGVEEHLGLLKDTGYEHVGAPWIEASTGITKAMRGA